VQPPRPDLVATAISPDYALGRHTASLGLASSLGTTPPAEVPNGMFIDQHGSWNRSHGGYKAIFVTFAEGRPSGIPVDVLTRFLSEDGNAYGRPVGVVINKRGALSGAPPSQRRKRMCSSIETTAKGLSEGEQPVAAPFRRDARPPARSTKGPRHHEKTVLRQRRFGRKQTRTSRCTRSRRCQDSKRRQVPAAPRACRASVTSGARTIIEQTRTSNSNLAHRPGWMPAARAERRADMRTRGRRQQRNRR